MTFINYHMVTTVRLGCWIALLLVPLLAVAAPAGEVVLVAGLAEIYSTQGSKRELQRGDSVEVGDILQTGINGHIHLRMVDKGFISVRPGSRLSIQDYAWNPESPGETRIRLMLEEGVVRSVTGQGGQAAKDRYRFNTPVAAIGIRGTDFTVFTSMAETRVSVTQGSVIAAPLISTCVAQVLGPCLVDGARILDAGFGQVVQINRNERRARVLDGMPRLAPDAVAPALPEEQRGSHGEVRSTTTRTTTSGSETVNLADADAVRSTHPILTVRSSESGDSTSNTHVVELGSSTPPSPSVHWGRWAKVNGVAGTPLSEITLDGHRVAEINDYFALTRSSEVVNLPTREHYDFTLQGGAAYIDSAGRGGVPTVASVDKGNLSIDFAQRQFQTMITVSSTSLASPVELQARGNVSPQGKLTSYGLGNTMQLRGILSFNASEAGYLFSSRLSDSRQITGVTHWQH